MGISETIKKGIKYVQHYGAKELLVRLNEKKDSQDISYAEFCKQEQISARELEKQRTDCQSWNGKPFLSVICITDDVELMTMKWSAHLDEQTYDHWELCVATSLEDGVRMAEEKSWLVFAEPQDTLEPNALYEVAQAIRNPKRCRQSGLHWEEPGAKYPDLLYTDEDITAIEKTEQTTEGESQITPWMKPDYSPVLLEEFCYIHHLLVVKRPLAQKGLADLSEADQRRVAESGDVTGCLSMFARRCAEKAKYIFHIPKVLYHHVLTEAEHEELSAVTGSELDDVIGLDRAVVADEAANEKKEQDPLISILIPNKDEKDTLEKCLASVRRSTYPNFEIIIVENNSTSKEIFAYYDTLTDARVVTWESNGVFNFSAINNFGATYARGEYLVFLNNDVEILTPDWLERLLADCQCGNTAAAGAKLYYPDDTIQHAGIMIGVGGHARGVAANMCLGMERKDPGYMHRASLRQNMSAVTAACMMMRKEVFDKVGGYTEYLTVAFNDVDLCLKVRKAGYEIIYDPNVEAYHYESKSRGMEDTPEKVRRFQTEIEYMRTQWEDILRGGDPYYNPNLSRYRMDYSLRRGK